jgi:hypothetical protein
MYFQGLTYSPKIYISKLILPTECDANFNALTFLPVAIIGGVAGAMAVILIVCVVAIAVHCTR